ncbi:MAG: LacI family DNA-binding transcriptional regulator [Coprobacillus sp.]
MGRKITMQDIAKQLNISVNAVSLALNDKEGVSNELRHQILEVAVVLNYPIKKLSVKKTIKNRTLIILFDGRKINDIYFYTDLINEIRKEAEIFGYRTITEFYDYESFRIPKAILDYHVAGVITLGNVTKEMIYSLKLYIQEIICVNHSISNFNIDTVIANDFLGGYISCEYLIKKGIRNIGFIGEISISNNYKKRYKGYLQCLKEHFKEEQENPIHLIKGIEEATADKDYQFIQNILSTYPQMPEAFICANDCYASVLIKALQYNGYRIPQDIKIISFDNTALSRMVTPALTSLEINRKVLAEKTIRRIHKMIHEPTTPETTMLNLQIIERESTK